MKELLKTILNGVKLMIPKKLSELENDLPSTSWNDLADRPFGEETTEILIFEETTFTDCTTNGVLFTPLADIEVGLEYTIIWNGVTYVCTAFTVDSANKEDLYCLGDGSQFAGSESTGEPFLIAGSPSGNLHIFVPLDGSTTVTMSINGPGVVVHQLDEKFIPDTIARVDDVEQMVADSIPIWDTLEGKPIETFEALSNYGITTKYASSISAYAIYLSSEITADGKTFIFDTTNQILQLYVYFNGARIGTAALCEGGLITINKPSTNDRIILNVIGTNVTKFIIYYDADGNYVSNEYTRLTYTNDVLIKGNTTEYTPTLDYDPATKLYVDTALTEKLSIAQGTDNAGKVMTVGEDGNVVAEDLPSDVFVVNITENEDGTYSADKTFAEIVEECQNGNVVLAHFYEMILSLCSIEEVASFELVSVGVYEAEFYNLQSLRIDISNDSVSVMDSGAIPIYNDSHLSVFVDSVNLSEYLTTTNKTIVSAINELKAEIDALKG